MELIRINDKKLKIMLTSSDMKNYELDAQKLSCGTEETRRAFRNILHDAGVGGGFDTGGDKIYVQYYPSREGGCEMFITKLDLLSSGQGAREEDNTSYKSTAEPYKGATISTQDCATIAQQAEPEDSCRSSEQLCELAYRFDSLASLLLACRHVLAAHHGTSRQKLISAAYRDEEGGFYLLLTPARAADAQAMLCRLLGEFGTAHPGEKARAYIHEHGMTLCSAHAVEVLGAL